MESRDFREIAVFVIFDFVVNVFFFFHYIFIKKKKPFLNVVQFS